MSDVLIKGMDMPTCEGVICACFNCEINDSCKLLKRGPYKLKGIKEEYRKKYCPLVKVPTPHGRLIDADELLNEMSRVHKRDGHLVNLFRVVEEAPTIIETEK